MGGNPVMASWMPGEELQGEGTGYAHLALLREQERWGC